MRAKYFKIISLTLVVLLAGSSHRALTLRADNHMRGLDPSFIDKSVNPGDDFFGYANGTWIKSTKIPEDHSSYGPFDVVIDEVNQETAELIKEAGKSANSAEAR